MLAGELARERKGIKRVVLNDTGGVQAARPQPDLEEQPTREEPAGRQRST
jgi:hypothetical protein